MPTFPILSANDPRCTIIHGTAQSLIKGTVRCRGEHLQPVATVGNIW